MNNLINKSKEERYQYFLVASEKSNLPIQIIEKDFWVCLLLEILFQMPELSSAITFKGGTSLSKAYRVIDRFSEDVDISIDKTFFGFINDRDPEKVTSNKHRQSLIEKMKESCQKYVKVNLIATLSQEITKLIGKDDWQLEVDETDTDLQTIKFTYPQRENNFNKSTYILSSIKLELGCRGEHWPTIQRDINPYVVEYLDLKKSNNLIRVLDISRTFWEKATILHMYANYPADKKVSLRQSRHYYDLYAIIKSSYFKEVESNLSLLSRVAEYKNIYFRSSWANYADAKTSLKLIPEKRVLDFMKDDYRKMREMFFIDPPAWGDILKTLTDYQDSLNILQVKAAKK